MNSRRQKLQTVQNKLILGVDIAKDKHWAILRLPDGTLMKPFAIYADGNGHQRFWQELPGHLGTYSLESLVVGLEPTGHYWKSLASFLYLKGVTVVLVNPLHTKKYKEIDDNSPLKSDKKDARLIADLVASGKFLRIALQQGSFAELRHLSADRAHVIEGIRRAKAYGCGLLHQLFPEWTKVFKSPWGMASRALMDLAVTPNAILALGTQKIEDILYPIVYLQDAKRRAQQLFELAQNSASVGIAQQSQVLSLRMLLARLALLEKQKEEIEKQMEELLEEIPYADLLLTIPHMSKNTLACLLGETGDIRNYNHAKELLKLAGLNLYQVTSGQQEKDESQIVRHITKRGRPRLRTSLYFMALRGAQRESPFRPFYQRLRDNKKPGKVALIALCRKILSTIYAMVRDESIFYSSLVTG